VLNSAPTADGQTRIEGSLERRVADRPMETHRGLDTIYGELDLAGGVRLRTITTEPKGAKRPLPAILYVQWLSCDSIELAANATDGWSRMLEALITRSGMIVQRTDKAGVGDSTGSTCSALDYDTELAHRSKSRARWNGLRASRNGAASRAVNSS
jgi:hypothetical protein